MNPMMIWNFLGIKGAIAVVLAIIIGFQWINIKALDYQLKTANETIGRKDVEIGGLKESIDKQNKAIEVVKKQSEDLQSRLNSAANERAKLRHEYEKSITDLLSRPIAKDCNESISEIKSFSINMNKRWNK